MTLTLSLETTKTSSSPCSICLQIPDNQTFLEPCYHSFCFSCILRWINITPSCPLCKQLTDSLVYNIDEEKGTFREYTLAGKNADDEHDPPVDPLPLTMEQRLYAQRQKIYHSSLKVIHPKPLQKFVNLSIIEPQHIQRARLFFQRELPILVGSLYEPMVGKHVECVLLIPHQRITSRKYNGSPITMYDPSVLEPLAEWVGDLPGETRIAKVFISELMGFIKSGMNYITFVSESTYKELE